MELLAKGIPWKSPNIQADAKTKGCSPETDNRAPLPRTIPTQLTEHGETELVPTWSLLPCVLVTLVWEGSLKATKKETWTPNQLPNL